MQYRHINPSLVLVQPRKTRPYITERLLMGRKESKQTNKHYELIQLGFINSPNCNKQFVPSQTCLDVSIP